jgi:hypothetical protein
MYSYGSSQQERVYQLSGKLTSILSALESDKGFYMDQIDKRVASLENSIYESIDQDNKKFKFLADKVQGLQDRFVELVSTREEFFKVKAEELADFELSISEEIGNNESRKKEAENKFSRVIDDRINSMQADLAREVKARKEGFDGLNEYYETNLVKVKDALKKEIDERDEGCDKVANVVANRVMLVREMVAAEKEAREKAEEALLAMLQDLVARMKKEIEDERNEREESEETLLSLLEDTCNKLNNITKY